LENRSQSNNTTDTSETASICLGKYRGRVLHYGKIYGKGSGSIFCDAIDGTVSVSAKDIVGPEPGNCKKQSGGQPNGPAVSFDLQWKKGKAHAINVRVVNDVASDQVEAPKASVALLAPLAPVTELQEVVERLRRLHGRSSASFYTSPCANRIGTPEGAIQYFVFYDRASEEAAGYIAYVEHVVAFMKFRYVVDDPVCAAANLDIILQDFILDCDHVNFYPMFPCVSADVATALRRQDFSTTMFGAELALPLRTFELSASQRRYLRAASKHGLECRTTCTDLDELSRLNKTWLASRPCQSEVTLMTLPPSLPKEADAKEDEVRRIFAYQHGRLVGFMEAEPYYCHGKIIGYGLNATRVLPNLKPCWISELMFTNLLETIKEEGSAEQLAFGFSPCTEIQPCEGEITWLRRLFEAIWDSGEDELYSFHGLAQKKEYYCNGQGVRRQDKFIAIPSALGVTTILRFTFLVFGKDQCMEILKCGPLKGWLWSWLLSTITEGMPQIPQNPLDRCKQKCQGYTATDASSHDVLD
jgi:hypothetical protein